MSYRTTNGVRSHLIFRGFSESFIQGEGEEKDSYESITEGGGNDGELGDGPSMRDLVSSLISGAIYADIADGKLLVQVRRRQQVVGSKW
ncbi:uncharacterized protein C2845_PM06G26280 [Panicum miliaceum]|uniref:Uncharacterized protein n=1 Tax=Panicum miliaceum TaxID=4540 RepID=A0A3L6REM2_PANMI|nr:uncharacterized protein C2845_PM06G26280 [Panicum miliaceum]